MNRTSGKGVKPVSTPAYLSWEHQERRARKQEKYSKKQLPKLPKFVGSLGTHKRSLMNSNEDKYKEIHIHLHLCKNKEKSRERRTTCRVSSPWLSADSHQCLWRSGQWVTCSKCWKTKILSTKNLTSSKTVLKNEGKIKAFPNKQNLRKCVASRPAF